MLEHINKRLKHLVQRFSVKNIWENGGNSVSSRTPTTSKYPTFCCALCLISANNESQIWEIQFQIEKLKKENNLKWNPETRASGERCIVANCVMPQEQELKEKLIECGFNHVHTFPRRNGYGAGHIEMLVFNI